ncbi:MAG: hypothetical protein AAF478_11495 [Pseudomonadota bacterium]
MSELIIAEHHDQVYSVWEKRGYRNLSVAHVDFHCDMRGIMIDRPASTAFFTSHRESTFVDRGNFLAHAIMKGFVTDLNWIHCQNSGRGSDVGPVVSYETDLLANWYRLKHRMSKRISVEFNFEEGLLSKWNGPRPGEQLDLDWDALASVEYMQPYKETMISDFLSRNFKHVPEVTFLVYSPGYSDPDRTLFYDFAKELAGKFKAEINELPKADLVTDGERFSALRGIAKTILPNKIRHIKRDISRWKNRYQATNDLAFYSKT